MASLKDQDLMQIYCIFSIFPKDLGAGKNAQIRDKVFQVQTTKINKGLSYFIITIPVWSKKRQKQQENTTSPSEQQNK